MEEEGRLSEEQTSQDEIDEKERNDWGESDSRVWDVSVFLPRSDEDENDDPFDAVDFAIFDSDAMTDVKGVMMKHDQYLPELMTDALDLVWEEEEVLPTKKVLLSFRPLTLSLKKDYFQLKLPFD